MLEGIVEAGGAETVQAAVYKLQSLEREKEKKNVRKYLLRHICLPSANNFELENPFGLKSCGAGFSSLSFFLASFFKNLFI